MQYLILSIKYLILAIIVTIAVAYGERTKVITMMKEIGTHTRYYPKRYVKVNRHIRELFKIEYKELPFFLYFELLMSVFFGFAFCVYPFLNDEKVALYFVLSVFTLYVLELTYIFICYAIFKRNDGNKKDNK